MSISTLPVAFEASEGTPYSAEVHDPRPELVGVLVTLDPRRARLRPLNEPELGGKLLPVLGRGGLYSSPKRVSTELLEEALRSELWSTST
jgi:hypothetical protein